MVPFDATVSIDVVHKLQDEIATLHSKLTREHLDRVMAERDLVAVEQENAKLRREIADAEETIAATKREMSMLSAGAGPRETRPRRVRYREDDQQSDGSGPPPSPQIIFRGDGQPPPLNIELARVHASEMAALVEETLSYRKRGVQIAQDFQLFVELQEARQRDVIASLYDAHTHTLLRAHQALLDSTSRLVAKVRERNGDQFVAWKDLFRQHAKEQDDVMAERLRVAASTYETYYLVPIVRNALSPPVARILQHHIKRLKADHEAKMDEWRDATRYFHSTIDRHWRSSHSLMVAYEHQVTSLFVEQVVDVFKEMGYDSIPRMMKDIRSRNLPPTPEGKEGLVRSRDSTPIRGPAVRAPPLPPSSMYDSSPAPLPRLNDDGESLLMMGSLSTIQGPPLYADHEGSVQRHAERTAALHHQRDPSPYRPPPQPLAVIHSLQKQVDYLNRQLHLREEQAHSLPSHGGEGTASAHDAFVLSLLLSHQYLGSVLLEHLADVRSAFLKEAANMQRRGERLGHIRSLAEAKVRGGVALSGMREASHCHPQFVFDEVSATKSVANTIPADLRVDGCVVAERALCLYMVAAGAHESSWVAKVSSRPTGEDVSTPGATSLANLFVELQVQRAAELLEEHQYTMRLVAGWLIRPLPSHTPRTLSRAPSPLSVRHSHPYDPFDSTLFKMASVVHHPPPTHNQASSVFVPPGPLSPNSTNDYLRGIAQEGASAVLETQRDQAVIVSRWLTSEMQTAATRLRTLLANNTRDKLAGRPQEVRQEAGAAVYANRNTIGGGPIGTPSGAVVSRVVNSDDDESFGEADSAVLTPPRRAPSPQRGRRGHASPLPDYTCDEPQCDYQFDFGEHCSFMAAALREVVAHVDDSRDRIRTLEDALQGYEGHIDECHAAMAEMRAAHAVEKEIYEDSIGMLVRQLRDERSASHALFNACRKEVVRVGVSLVEWQRLAAEYKSCCEEVLGVWRAVGAITDTDNAVWTKGFAVAAAADAGSFDSDGEGRDIDDEEQDDSLRLTYPEGVSYKSRRQAAQMRQKLQAEGSHSSYFAGGRSVVPRSRGPMSTISLTPTTAAQLQKEAVEEAKALVGADSAVRQHMALGNALLYAHNMVVESLCEGCVAVEEMEMIAAASANVPTTRKASQSSRAFNARASRLSSIQGAVRARLDDSERIDALVGGEFALAALEETVLHTTAVFYDYFSNLRESWCIAQQRSMLVAHTHDNFQQQSFALHREAADALAREEGLRRDYEEQSQRCEMLDRQVHDLNRQVWLLRSEVASMHAKLDLKRAHIADIEEQLELIETATGAEMEAKKLAILGIRDVAAAPAVYPFNRPPSSRPTSPSRTVGQSRHASRSESPVRRAEDFGFAAMLGGNSRQSPYRMQTPPRPHGSTSPKRGLFHAFLRSDSSPYSRD